MFAFAVYDTVLSCDLQSMDPSTGARQAQWGGDPAPAGHFWDVCTGRLGLQGVDVAYGRWEDGSCPAADPASDPGENGAPIGALSGVAFRGPARRPRAISTTRRSAILAPRCQAAGGGESVLILKDYSWKAQYHHWEILIAWLESGYWFIDSYRARVICAPFLVKLQISFAKPWKCYALLHWPFSNPIGIICPVPSMRWFRCRTPSILNHFGLPRFWSITVSHSRLGRYYPGFWSHTSWKCMKVPARQTHFHNVKPKHPETFLQYIRLASFNIFLPGFPRNSMFGACLSHDTGAVRIIICQWPSRSWKGGSLTSWKCKLAGWGPAVKKNGSTARAVQSVGMK